MGLDVYLEYEGKQLTWDHAVMESFPFTVVDETYGADEYHGEVTYKRIVEITGMYCEGLVSFRGRSYSHTAEEIGLPYSFYDSLSEVELSEQTQALGIFLDACSDLSDDYRFSHYHLIHLRNLYKLLMWSVRHGLSTFASS